MWDQFDLKSTLVLTLFAFIGGLTRELNDIINNRLHIKSFVVGLITASTTGLIVSQILLEYQVGSHMSCFLTGISGFMGPYVLLSLARIVKRRLDKIEAKLKKDIKQDKDNDFV